MTNKTTFAEWLKTMSEMASYSDQRELLRVVLNHYTEEQAQKATAQESKPAANADMVEPKMIKVPCPKLGKDTRCVMEGCDMASDEDYNKGKCVVETYNPKYRPVKANDDEGLVEELRELIKICRGENYEYKEPASISANELEQVLSRHTGPKEAK